MVVTHITWTETKAGSLENKVIIQVQQLKSDGNSLSRLRLLSSALTQGWGLVLSCLLLTVIQQSLHTKMLEWFHALGLTDIPKPNLQCETLSDQKGEKSQFVKENHLMLNIDL